MDRHNKMLIDATHPEETRVVVLRNGRIEEFDYESASRKLLRGNIYLAKVTRVEPSLQAAFVDYGGNRHGFLAFSEIHPDYYQIPVADRELLKQEEAEEEARLEAEVEERANRRSRRGERGERSRDRDRGDRGDRGDRHDRHERGDRDRNGSGGYGADAAAQPYGTGDQPDIPAYPPADPMPGGRGSELPVAEAEPAGAGQHDAPVPPQPAYPPGAHGEANPETLAARHATEPTLRDELPPSGAWHGEPATGDTRDHRHDHRHDDGGHAHDRHDRRARYDDDRRYEVGDAPEPIGNVEDVGVVDVNGNGANGDNGEAEHIEEVSTEEDALEEVPERPRRRMRQYKIQEVIKRRQIILVQVVKEERGNKGAALTTYISLAGRYTVLMPNTGRGGGISRKITQPQDRKRLKAIAEELDVPEGMGLIIRTAGAARTKQEIKRDYEYLLRLWESVRELTLNSTAPCLVYEEGNLIKRSIRDLYSKDIDQVVVAGGGAFREAHDFMGMLMPGHADNVARYDGSEPLFTRFGIERQLNAMFSPYVTLRSGGYLVINQTEALVAIDVNSGKSTREFSIEETALNTNVEAAEEIARQLKLRDLAGLIVVDFIDMEEKRNNRTVERRLKDALRNDRARIQVGRISHFGLLEMSRQRLRTGVLEGSTSQCPHCQGTGIIRSTESVALAVLRGLEDQLMKQPTSLIATTTSTVALYILNHKRSFINDMEGRHGIAVAIEASDKMQGANFSIERMATPAGHQPAQRSSGAVSMDWGFDDEAEAEADGEADEPRREEARRDEPRREDARRDESRRDEPREARRDDSRRDDSRREEQRRDEPRRESAANGAAHHDADDGDDAAEQGDAQGEARGGRRRRRRRARRDREGGEAQVMQPGDSLAAEGDGNHPTAYADADDSRDFAAQRAEYTDDVRDAAVDAGDGEAAESTAEASEDLAAGGETGEGDRPRRGRRRGRRGGRGRAREQGGALPDIAMPGADQPSADGLPGLEAEWRRSHMGAATGDDGHAQRPTIIEYVAATEVRASEQAQSVGIVEMASSASFEPVAPIPAYPKAAPMPSWSDPIASPPAAAAAAAAAEREPATSGFAGAGNGWRMPTPVIVETRETVVEMPATRDKEREAVASVTVPTPAAEPAITVPVAPEVSMPEPVAAPPAATSGAAPMASATEPTSPPEASPQPSLPMEHREPERQPEPALAAAPAPAPEEPPSPPRRGWWQRRFGSG